MNLQDAKVGSSQRAQKMALEALRVPAMALAALAAPGYVISMLAHMASGNGYSVSETLSSAMRDPSRQLPAYALGRVGEAMMTPIYPYVIIRDRINRMQSVQSDRAISQAHLCVKLLESGQMEELGELLAGMSFKSSAPLKDESLRGVAEALFKSAFKRDDERDVGALIKLNGGKLWVFGDYGSERPLLFMAAQASAIKSARSLLDAGADPTLRESGVFAESMTSSVGLKKMLRAARGDRVRGLFPAKARPGY